METAGLYIGLDVGTQSTKGLLVDVRRGASSAIVARAAEPYDLLPGLPAGAAEQHPHTWRDAVQRVIAALLSGVNPAEVRGIGVSGQQHGLVTLDEQDEVVRPAKLWCDTTTTAEAQAISARAKRLVPSGFTLPKLLWMKHKEPANFERVRSVLLPHDYINFLLSGRKFMEAGDASGSGAFEPEWRRFDRALLQWVDASVPEMFPELVVADLPGAAVSAAGARFFGLPEGIPLAPGGGDNMMSAIGSGATRGGETVVSLGTSGTVFAYSDKPVVDPNGAVAAFCDSTGAWLPLLCTMNVTAVTEEVRTLLGKPSHEAITAQAAQVSAGSDGLTFLPYLQGERVPNLPHATGALLGMRHTNLSPGHLFRAAIEGATLGLVSGIGRMKRLGLEVDSVRLVGGGSKNPLWRQIMADALQVPVATLVEPEAAALGAALQAFWVSRRAAGEDVSADEAARPLVQLSTESAEPNSAHRAVYRDALERFEAQTVKCFG